MAYGFFLHDIGKVGIPESILCKAGPLTDLEWIVMQSHPNQGARIVEPIPFMGEAVEIVRSHHERFDGGGYPRGLRGEEIPLAARIFAIADSFDAMTSDRPYRSALSTDEAVAEIVAGSGTQFDQSVSRHSRSSPRKTTGSSSATGGSRRCRRSRRLSRVAPGPCR